MLVEVLLLELEFGDVALGCLVYSEELAKESEVLVGEEHAYGEDLGVEDVEVAVWGLGGLVEGGEEGVDLVQEEFGGLEVADHVLIDQGQVKDDPTVWETLSQVHDCLGHLLGFDIIIPRHLLNVLYDLQQDLIKVLLALWTHPSSLPHLCEHLHNLHSTSSWKHSFSTATL